MFEESLCDLTTLKGTDTQEMHDCKIISRESMSFFSSLSEVIVSLGKTEIRVATKTETFSWLLSQIETSHIIHSINISFY